MTTHCYSPFWLGYAAGRVRLSAIWADRELALRRAVEVGSVEAVPPTEMHAWLRLSDQEHSDQVFAYAGTRPPRIAHRQQQKGAARAARLHD